MITGRSALPTPEGAFHRATIPNYTNGRKRGPLKHRFHLFRLEEKMGKQGKNRVNNMKYKTVPSEISGYTIERPENPNTEENYLENNFMKSE